MMPTVRKRTRTSPLTIMDFRLLRLKLIISLICAVQYSMGLLVFYF